MVTLLGSCILLEVCYLPLCSIICNGVRKSKLATMPLTQNQIHRILLSCSAALCKGRTIHMLHFNTLYVLVGHNYYMHHPPLPVGLGLGEGVEVGLDIGGKLVTGGSDEAMLLTKLGCKTVVDAGV